MDKLISNDQTGFISGRYIGENTRLIYDVMHYAEEYNIPGLLLIIDFEKAFDSVSWKFIDEVLKFFNFGESIIKWINVFQKNSKFSVNQGGNLTKFVKLQRGCRQGDPLSPYIFLLCVEVLSLRLKQNPSVRGITIEDLPILISQYADDTTLILDGSEISLKAAMNELQSFANISGLKINVEKTQVVWIGSEKFSNKKCCPNWNLQWGITHFSILGMIFDIDLHKITTLNFDKKIVKLKQIINMWNKRRLTPIGKITIIKSLLISQFNHLFISLPSPNEKYIKMINTELYNFLWNSKVDKIKRDIVVKEYINGGLQMVNLVAYINSLKLSWIRRMFTSEGKWKKIITSKVDMMKLSNCGPRYIKICKESTHNLFWKDVLDAWLTLIKKEKINYEDKLLLMPIWYNEKFLIDNQTIFFKNWYEKGVLTVNDLWNSNSFYTLDEFNVKFNMNCNYLQYYSVISVVKKIMKNVNFNLNQPKVFYPYIPLHLQSILKQVKGSKKMYEILNTNSTLPTSQGKWSFFSFDQSTWNNIYILPFTVTKDSKLQWLQYRINHHILTTNKYLYKVGLTDSSQCSFCKSHTETILHILWECDKVQILLNNLKRITELKDIPFLTLDREIFLFGVVDQKDSLTNVNNIILLIIKAYIYRMRCLNKNLSIVSLLKDIKYNFMIQKYISKQKDNNQMFDHWVCWDSLLETLHVFQS